MDVEGLNVSVLNVYRSPSGCFDGFLDSLCTLFEQLLGSGRWVILSGDFNVHFNAGERACSRLIELVACYGLRKTVFEPTRGENCLDNVLVGFSLEVEHVQVLDVGLSDHKGQIVEVALNLKVSEAKEKNTFRPITQKGLNELYNKLENTYWSFIGLTTSDPEKKFDRFVQILENAFVGVFPEKTYVRRPSDVGSGFSWFDGELRNTREHLGFLNDLKNRGHVNTRVYQWYRFMYKKKIKQA